VVKNGRIHNVVSLAGGIKENGFLENSIRCSKDEDLYVLTFVFERG
jgi:hypothetical protein